MNHHQVPNFLPMEGGCWNPPSNTRSKNPATGEEGVTELVWENGHLISQAQIIPDIAGDGETPAAREIRLGREEQQQQQQNLNLFMEENEMASWLQYPIDDFFPDLLSPPPQSLISTITQAPDFPPTNQPPPVVEAREPTVVESSSTPAARVNVESGGTVTCEQTVTSASRTSLCEADQRQQRPVEVVEVAEDRKRKGRENEEDNENQSENKEIEAPEAKKPANGSTPTKRSRAAEIHNLSERKRRDRINERMKILQDLVPRSNKIDKASMLDEVIEYVKSLQMQLNLMSMGHPMVNMMYRGTEQYVPVMGLGRGMNQQPMVPYHPSMLPSSSTLNPAAHMCPTFPMRPQYPMPQVHMPDPRTLASSSNQVNYAAVNFPQFPNQPSMTDFLEQYQQYVALFQGQYPIPQNLGVSQPGADKPSTSKDVGNTNPDRQSG